MMQIENEIGMLESARDHSPLAEKVYRQSQWAERYGTDVYADEKFMALHYARYVEHLAKAARGIHDMLLYVNAAMNSRGRRPGEYPSAGPLAHLVDFWHEGAPSIDLLAPDIYDTGFKSWCAQYAMPLRPQDGGKALTQHPSPVTLKNRLFIPESRCCENSGVRALYAFGEHQALGFSPFAIDQATPAEAASVTNAYHLLRQVYSIIHLPSSIIHHPSSITSYGLLFDQTDRERIIDDDGVVVTCRHYFTLPWDPRANDGTTWPEGAHPDFSFNAFNEGTRLEHCIKMHKRLLNVDAKKIGGDTGYAGSANRNLCKELGIQTSFVKRGRPTTEKNDKDYVRQELARVRATAMEGSFGTQKEHYDMRRIKARKKKTEILYIFFGIHTANVVHLAERLAEQAKAA